MSRAPSQPVTLPEGTVRDFAPQIGLNLSLDKDRAILRQMRAEARIGYKRLCQDRACLLPYLQSDTSVRPPFTATQISEAALRDEVDRIHASAVDETKVFYDRKTAVGAANAGSWVVRWLLWYLLLNGDHTAARDSFEAQLCAQRPRKSPEATQRRSIHAPNGDANDQTANDEDGGQIEQSRKRYWDPARPT